MNHTDPLLIGIPASPGKAKGRVFIADVSGSEEDMPEGSVLVTRYATPLLISLVLKACAWITDVGGAMSHAANIAREYGIPCVTGTENATSVLKDGLVVLVDGEKGHVYEKE